jgi:ArsR family transcriptional regulator
LEEDRVVCICKALGDANRLRIVQMLTEGERCACDLLEKLQVTQPTLSHHMKILVEANLVFVRREGKWMHYSLNCEVLTAYREFIGTLRCEDRSASGERRCCK